MAGAYFFHCLTRPIWYVTLSLKIDYWPDKTLFLRHLVSIHQSPPSSLSFDVGSDVASVEVASEVKVASVEVKGASVEAASGELASSEMASMKVASVDVAIAARLCRAEAYTGLKQYRLAMEDTEFCLKVRHSAEVGLFPE